MIMIKLPVVGLCLSLCGCDSRVCLESKPEYVFIHGTDGSVSPMIVHTCVKYEEDVSGK